MKTTTDFSSLFPNCLYGFLPDRHWNAGGVFEKTEITEDDLNNAKLKNYGSFFTPNGHGDIKNPKGTLLRWDGNVINLNACFADFDSGSKESQIKTINSMPLPYSLLIESKRGFHVYWMLKPSKNTPSEDISLWRRIQTTIATTYGADKNCSNPSRLMRLPGSYHMKSDPYLVEIKQANNVLYTIDELELAFPPPPRKVFNLSPTYKKKLKMPDIVSIHDGARHDTLKETAGRLYAHAKQEDAAAMRDLMKAWYSSSCINLKPYWEKEVDDVCSWMEAHEWGSNS